MTSDDQMEFDIECPRSPNCNIGEDVTRFLTIFEVPKVNYQIALEMATEMFKPLPEEQLELEAAVRQWCGLDILDELL